MKVIQIVQVRHVEKGQTAAENILNTTENMTEYRHIIYGGIS